MKVLVNGDAKELRPALSLQQLLDDLQLPAGRVACELNMKVVRRALFPETVLQEGDTIEIIQAIGGG